MTELSLFTLQGLGGPSGNLDTGALSGYPDAMTDDRSDPKQISSEGTATISAVDSYLEETIREGRPIEALIGTRRLGEIVNERSKEAARAATDGSWSWSDVGRALGMTKQAAHEKLRARVHDELAKGLSKLEESEERGHAKIARRAKRGRDGLDRAAAVSPKVDSARQRIDEWEEQHAKLDRNLGKARDEIERADQSVANKPDRKT